MTLAQLRAVIEEAESKGTHIGCSPRLMRKLLDVIEAAGRIPETDGVHQVVVPGWRELKKAWDALAALEASL